MQAGRLREDGTVIPKTKQSMSFGDIQRMVSNALDRIHNTSRGGNTVPLWPYIEEIYPDSVVYNFDDKYLRRSYSIIDDEVIFGDAAEVEEVYMPKQSLAVLVDSMEGVTHFDGKRIDRQKGVYVLCAGDGREIQYLFDLNKLESRWTYETALSFIQARRDKKVSSVLQATLGAVLEPVKQMASLSPDMLAKLKEVDAEPLIVPIKVTYGVGSNKQHFDKAFFETAGAKFEGTPLFINHSDLNEFGDANPIGSIVKFAGADEANATFLAYISASEGTWRQKIKESQALGNKGFVKRVSIEGIPSKDDFTVDQKTGIKYFHDLAMPTGIAIVNREGLKGSQITN
jgi:hypothetical protein